MGFREPLFCLPGGVPPEDLLDGDPSLDDKDFELIQLSDEDALLVRQRPAPEEDWVEVVSRKATQSHTAKEVCHALFSC